MSESSTSEDNELASFDLPQLSGEVERGQDA